jgi:hypothetical protein
MGGKEGKGKLSWLTAHPLSSTFLLMYGIYLFPISPFGIRIGTKWASSPGVANYGKPLSYSSQPPFFSTQRGARGGGKKRNLAQVLKLLDFVLHAASIAVCFPLLPLQLGHLTLHSGALPFLFFQPLPAIFHPSKLIQSRTPNLEVQTCPKNIPTHFPAACYEVFTYAVALAGLIVVNMGGSGVRRLHGIAQSEPGSQVHLSMLSELLHFQYLKY